MARIDFDERWKEDYQEQLFNDDDVSNSKRREAFITCPAKDCDGCLVPGVPFGRRRDYVGGDFPTRRRGIIKATEPRWEPPLGRRRGLGAPPPWPIQVGTPEAVLVTCIVDLFDEDNNFIIALGTTSTKTQAKTISLTRTFKAFS